MGLTKQPHGIGKVQLKKRQLWTRSKQLRDMWSLSLQFNTIPRQVVLSRSSSPAKNPTVLTLNGFAQVQSATDMGTALIQTMTLTTKRPQRHGPKLLEPVAMMSSQKQERLCKSART